MDTQNSDKCQLPGSGVQGQSGPVVTPSVLVHCPPTQSQCYFLKEVVNPASRHSGEDNHPHKPSFIIHLLPVVQKCPVHRVLPSTYTQTRQRVAVQGPSWDPQEQRSATFRAFVKNFQHRAKERGAETLCSILQDVVAELKIKKVLLMMRTEGPQKKF